MNDNPHEVLGKSPFSDESPILSSCESQESEDFQENSMTETCEGGRLPKKFQWMKGYKKEVRDVLGEIVQTIRENEYLGSSSSEAPLFETTISMELPEVGTTPLHQILPPPGNSLRRIIQEIEYAQQKEEIEENLCISKNQEASDENSSLEKKQLTVLRRIEAATVSQEGMDATEVPLPIEQSEEKEEAEKVASEEASFEAATTSILLPSARRFPRWMKEMALGLLLGILVLAALSFFHMPLEERLQEALRGEHFSEVVGEPSEKSLFPGTICWKDVEWTPSDEESLCETILASRLAAKIYPFSWAYGPLRIEKLTLQGIRFPLLQTVWETDRETSEPFGMVASSQKLDEKMASLRSLAWIEEIKERYLPCFEKMSGRLEALEKEAVEIRTVMNETLLKENEPTQEMTRTVERLAEIREESDGLQNQWKETSSEVAAALSQISGKISSDGQELAKILQKEGMTEKSLEMFLYTSETSRQLRQILKVEGALERLLQAMLLPNEAPPETLETTGEVELCGEIFRFSGAWNTERQENCLRSFYGTMELCEGDRNEEKEASGSLMLSCRQKKNLNQRHFALRIPLGLSEISLGSRKEPLALHSVSDGGVLELECDLFDDEIQGTLRITRRGLSWKCDESAPKAFQEAIAEWSEDSHTWEVTLSGTLESPLFHYTQTAVEQLLPIYTRAAQESTQQKRRELVKQIYGKLKNAETMFNSALEPYYRRMSASTENIMRIHERLASRVTIRSEMAPVMIAEIQLDTSEEAIGEEIPMFDPTLGEIEESASAVGAQVEISEKESSASSSVPSAASRFVPVKKVAVIAPPVEEEASPAEASSPGGEKNSSLKIMPMEATFFTNSTPNALETPLVTAEMTPPHGPLPLAIGERASSPAQKEAMPQASAASTSPSAKNGNMPVPAMRSATLFGG